MSGQKEKSIIVENMRDRSERYRSDVPGDITVGELREALGGERVKLVCRGRIFENDEKLVFEEVPEGEGDIVVFFVPPKTVQREAQRNVAVEDDNEFEDLDAEDGNFWAKFFSRIFRAGIMMVLVMRFFRRGWKDVSFALKWLAVLALYYLGVHKLLWRYIKYLFPSLLDRDAHFRKKRKGEPIEKVTSENAEKGGLENVHGRITAKKPCRWTFISVMYVVVRCFFEALLPEFDLDIFADRYPWLPVNKAKLKKDEERRARDEKEELERQRDAGLTD